MNPIVAFIDSLAAAPASEKVRNPYAGLNSDAIACRANLFRYLSLMAEEQPRVLLVGEAPGYRGCGRTGIPFTSEAIIVSHQQFGLGNGFSIQSGSTVPMREASATIVWQTLDGLALRPLLWNVVPFHPHKPGAPGSNRTPTLVELQGGERYLRQLLGLYPIERVIAVGQKAQQSLVKWGIAAQSVRHPAHGGAAKFRQQLHELSAQTV